MAVSSANISGRPAALTCDEAIEQLGDSVAIYLDGGPLSDASGAPSTIVDFTRNEDGQVLRRGAISVETLRETAPDLVDVIEKGKVADESASTTSGRSQDEDESLKGAGENQDEDESSNGAAENQDEAQASNGSGSTPAAGG
jgi:L-threonylcarbamoyladenylate synthase